MNQRTMLIAKMLREGDFSDSEELIQLELEERSEKVSKIVGESIMHQIFESVNTKNVKGLGKVEANNRSIAVKDVKDLDHALKLAPKFAEFVEGKGKYSAKASSLGDSITISKGGSSLFDISFDENSNTLELEIEVSKEDLETFRKTGRLDESFEEITEAKDTTIKLDQFSKSDSQDLADGLYNERGIKVLKVAAGYIVVKGKDLDETIEVLTDVMGMDPSDDFSVKS